ncbi:prepilin peptidase [Bacillus timonensis]|uniref:prepilin peptidase n=1 Tax=Bacillus timonensis TaxID=1033734 RepID=UPI000289F811|nr:A24 family peptidase [Bacillus timonensis]
METILLIYLFIIGLLLGSFFNVVGLRIPNNESIVKPRSHCTSCNRTLTAIDLVPVFSYIFLKGKCRTCGTKISAIYPLIELLTGLLFAFSFYKVGFNQELIVALAFVSLLMIITVSDIHYMLIPDKVLLFFLVILGIARVCSPVTPWWDSIIGAIVGFGLLALIAIVSKGGMGGGDIKLFFLIGLVLGTKETLLAFFLSTLIGAVIGGFGMLIGKIKRNKPIPFGPFIVIGSLMTYYYGDTIIEWYLTLF